MQEISRISYTVINCGSVTCLLGVWNAGCFWKFPVYTCVRINNKVRHSIGLNQRPLKSTVRHLLRISGLREQLQNICKKVFRMFGVYAVKQYFCTRFRGRNADELKYWTKMRFWTLPLQKKLFEKKLRKSFGSSKISLTFASAFEKKAIKKSSLKDLDMNKLVVQFLHK